jgi:hypothetical protein
MRDRDGQLSPKERRLEGHESARTIASIEMDFAGLVAILERQLELVSSSDQRIRSHLTSAKAAAERGVKLSRELRELAKESR